MKKLFSSFFILNILLLHSTALTLENNKKLNLSQKSVIQKILDKSLEYKKIQASSNIPLQNLATQEAFLDWQLFSNLQFSSETQNTINFFENPSLKNTTFSTGVSKKFITGSLLLLQYSMVSLEREFTPEFKQISSSPANSVNQQLELQIEQDLIRNIFGYEDKIKLNIASLKVNNHNLKLLEQTEDLILQAIQFFWTTYTHYTSLQLKQSKKQDYQELLKITKNKNKYGYTKPGELSQIQAEWERAKQEFILQKTEYEEHLSKLLRLLNYPIDSKVEFIIDKNILPPSLKKIAKTPRTVSLAKKNLLIQKQQLKLEKSSAWPYLKLFGSYGIGGYNTNFSSALDGLTNRENKNQTFGFKLTYPLPNTKVRKNKTAWKEQEVKAHELDLDITKKEFDRMIKYTEKKLQSLYDALQSAKKIQKLRDKSYKEIRKAYRQGRLSVFELISAKEFSLQSNLLKTQLKAEYHRSLSYAKAIRDQLISSESP